MSDAHRISIPAMSARAFEVAAGAVVRIVDESGGQPGDLVAFVAGDAGERLSQARTRVECKTFRPTVGHALWSNALPPRPLLTIVGDTAPAHDLLYPACCRFALRKRFSVDRDGCQEHLVEALSPWGIRAADVPDPLNLFFRVEARADGALAMAAGGSRPGDWIELRADVSCLLAVAACAVPRADGRPNSGYAISVGRAMQ